ncbi:hypothetical protein FACS189425_10080 [Clostridia bacterium]|nr:hypothetical protein FACS189425_10080 [Clostridia bacterium]
MKVANTLNKIFYGVFGVIVFLILIGDFLVYKGFSVQVKHILYAVIWVVIFAAALFFFQWKKKFINKHFKWIVAISLVIYAMIQFYFVWVYHNYPPVNDYYFVRRAADSLWQGGALDNEGYLYLARYQHQWGYFALSYLWTIVFHIFDVSYVWPASMTNIIVCAATFLITALVCKKLWNPVIGIFGLFLCLSTYPFAYGMIMAYTDTLSMLAPILGFYIYLCAKEKPTLWKYALMGLVFAIGALIKPTVLAMFIAIIIDIFVNMLRTKDKAIMQNIVRVGVAIVVIIALNMTFTSIMKATVLTDSERLAREKMPIANWIMIGVGEGKYELGYFDWEDFLYLASLPDVQTRSVEAMRLAKERLTARGFGGNVNFYARKMHDDMLDGTMFIVDFIVRYEFPIATLEKHPIAFGLLGREFDMKFGNNLSMNGNRVAIFAIILVYVYMLIRGRKRIPENSAPFYAIFGLIIFLLFWEQSPRLSTCFVPILYIGLLQAICSLSEGKNQ